ncbi:glycosyl hydrolase family 19 domain-containing protein HI_1415-like [Oratosquilla oratoria]|uniref:glycosyl hydrolase family 19 domain-containing protein HI_1415-like n=1 Tax=Oratosquilla oratoria TaxID=337810 RepID=UPI003F761433
MAKHLFVGLLAALLISQISAAELTLKKLRDIMKCGTKASADKYFEAIKSTFKKYNINTPLRQAHFLAQIGHESSSLKATEENLNYSKKALLSDFENYFPTDALAEEYARKPEKIANRIYANRLGNGNEASGDGWKYRGRGLIQLTGKANYEQFNKNTKENVVANPDLVASDANLAVEVAGWYWNSRNINKAADADDVEKVTKLVNGGDKGLKKRKEYLARAMIALGIKNRK